MEKNVWTEQHSQLWTTPKRGTISPPAGCSMIDKPLETAVDHVPVSPDLIVAEILSRLEGGDPAKYTGIESLQDNLYRILMKVEECEESAEAALGHMKASSSGDSLREKIRAVENACEPIGRASEKEVHSCGEGAQNHIADILRPYGNIETEGDARSLLLTVIRDYERLKQNAAEKEPAVETLERQLSRVAGLYGDCVSGGDSMENLRNWRPWIETPLTLLYDEVSKALAACGEAETYTITEPFLSVDASHSRTNIVTVLRGASECARRLRCQLNQSPSVTNFTTSDRGASIAESAQASDSCFQASVEALIDSFPPEIVAEFQLEHHAGRRNPQLAAAIRDSVRALATRREGGGETALFIINSLDRSLKRSFHLHSSSSSEVEDAPLSLSCALQNLETTVASVLAYPHESPQRESEYKREIASAVDDLAQLLPSSSEATLPVCSGIRIEPPTSSLTEMVQLLKTRFLSWSQRQQKQLLSGAHNRGERDRVLEMVRKYVKDLLSITSEMNTVRLTDATVTSDSPGMELVAETRVEEEGVLSPLSVEMQLNNLVDRFRVLKTQYAKMNQDTLSLRSRLDASAQRNTVQAKWLRKAAESVTRLCESLHIDESVIQEMTHKESDTDKLGNGPTNARLSSRHAQDRSPRTRTAAVVTDSTLVDALHAVEARVSGDGELLKKSELEHQQEETAQLTANYEKDKAAFAEAMKTILARLAESGKLVKQSLFMLGTDESASDDAVQDALTLLNHSDTGSEPATDEAEKVERTLAALLQKYSRWSRRLCETTEDHLVTQQKIAKYFSAIQRFFSSSPEASRTGVDILDENLIDIDTSLMRSADVILPALDRAIRAAGDGRASDCTPDVGGAVGEDPEARRKEAVEHLAAQASNKTSVLPYDHRLGRLYDMVNRLHTAITSLQRVRYLAIPSEVKHRGSGDVELLFDDGYSPSDYVDLDLDKLIVMPTTGATPTSLSARFVRQDATSASSAIQSSGLDHAPTSVNDDRILQAITQNLECAQQALKKFSSDHKLCAIIIQKDTDTMQQLLATMLEKYSELDVEKAFGQDREQLRDLYTALHERAGRQKGCYFFNRVGGEGKCVWTSALDQLCTGFNGIVDKLIQRTELASTYRDLIDDVVDLCAMFVNWSRQHPLPVGHELHRDVLDDCVREGSDGDDDRCGNDSTRGPSKASLPPMLPKPNAPPSAKAVDGATGATGAAAVGGDTATSLVVSHFRHDETVLKVIEQMFRLAQMHIENGAAVADGPRATSVGATQVSEEELVLLRETVAVADQRAAALTEEKRLIEQDRDKARSEAAIARAQLRRLQKDRPSAFSTTPDMASPSQPLPTPTQRHPLSSVDSVQAPPTESTLTARGDTVTQSSSRVPTNSIDQDCLEELLQYMRVLGHELQYAQSVSRGEDRVGAIPMPSAAAPTAPESGEVESFVEDERNTSGSSAGRNDDGWASDVNASPTSRRQRLKALERRLQGECQTPLVVDVMDSRRQDQQVTSDVGRRYSPSRHRGGDYEVCEGCVRHHGRTLPTRLQSPFDRKEPTRQTPMSTRRVADVHTTSRLRTQSASRDSETRDIVPSRLSRSQQRPQSGTTNMSPSSNHASHPTRKKDESQMPSERFFDDDVYAGPRPYEGRTSSAMRTHPLRTTALTPRPARQPYCESELPTRPSTASRHPHASPHLRRQAGRAAHDTRTTAEQTRPRVGRAKSPDHFDSAVRVVQEAGRRDPRSEPSPHGRGVSTYAENPNLRSAALRRLAEVVSQTKVKGPGGRYY